MSIPKFWIESPDDEVIELFVGELLVGRLTHEEHGWDGMKAGRDLFKKVAETLGAAFEQRFA